LIDCANVVYSNVQSCNSNLEKEYKYMS
jgi:hypothetical protein